MLKTGLQGYLEGVQAEMTALGNLGGVSAEAVWLDWQHFPLPSQRLWGSAGRLTCPCTGEG